MSGAIGGVYSGAQWPGARYGAGGAVGSDGNLYMYGGNGYTTSTTTSGIFPRLLFLLVNKHVL